MRTLWKIGVFAVIVVAAIGYQMWKKSDLNAEVRQQAYQRYAGLGDDAKVHQLVDRFHDECFDACYRSGGRRRAASFDTDRYERMLDERVLRQLPGAPAGSPGTPGGGPAGR